VKYRYYTCDVFTDTRFGGNPLAVLPSADGLSDHQMLACPRIPPRETPVARWQGCWRTTVDRRTVDSATASHRE
jgi:hypothetical protein